MEPPTYPSRHKNLVESAKDMRQLPTVATRDDRDLGQINAWVHGLESNFVLNLLSLVTSQQHDFGYPQAQTV